ncbi:MAG: cyclase [Betaproteobacteria bacterium]|nr:cyclase [Betaproteobacteria bacterium]
MVRAALLLLVLNLACPAEAADVLVRASRDGDVLRVEASAEFESGLEHAWQVLTDYDHLAGFIPGMRESRVIERGAHGPIVEQKGEVRLLFLSYAIEVRLAIEEYPCRRIVSRAVAGSFRHMSGAYLIEAVHGRVRLRYAGTLVPNFYVPPLIGTLVLRLSIERQFGALVDEILRRHGDRAPARPET